MPDVVDRAFGPTPAGPEPTTGRLGWRHHECPACEVSWDGPHGSDCWSCGLPGVLRTTMFAATSGSTVQQFRTRFSEDPWGFVPVPI